MLVVTDEIACVMVSVKGDSVKDIQSHQKTLIEIYLW